MLGKIVYEVKLLNGGQLPSLNMIGYSMGGLLNMRYALDHPGMVRSLISLGTPYFGSNVTMIYGEGGENFRAQREDINNSEIYNEMAERWNAGRETLYADVSFHAFGGYSTFDFVTACLAEEYWWVYPLSLITNQVVAGLVPVVEMAEFVADIVGLEGKPTDDPNFMTGLRNFVSSFGYDGWQALLLRPTLFDDISVQLPSALASNSPYQGAASTLEYAGVIRHPIKLTLFNSDISKAATMENLPIVHNLLPRHEKIVQGVLQILGAVSEESQFLTYQVSASSVGIRGYVGTDSQLTIPDTINEKTVVEIGDYAFSENQTLHSVTMPATVQKIGIGAFENCGNLQSVTSQNGQLNEIGAGAFENCSSLTTLSAGSGIRKVGDYAFAGCTSLNQIGFLPSVERIGAYAFAGCSMTSFTVPRTVTELGAGFVSGCGSLTEIHVDGQNAAFMNNSEGVLFNKSQTVLLAFPNGKTVTNNTYTVPAGVTAIGDYAFSGNDSLVKIKLNDVTVVGRASFLGCSNLAELEADQAFAVDDYAIMGTLMGFPENQLNANFGFSDVELSYDSLQYSQVLSFSTQKSGKFEISIDNYQAYVMIYKEVLGELNGADPYTYEHAGSNFGSNEFGSLLTPADSFTVELEANVNYKIVILDLMFGQGDNSPLQTYGLTIEQIFDPLPIGGPLDVEAAPGETEYYQFELKNGPEILDFELQSSDLSGVMFTLYNDSFQAIGTYTLSGEKYKAEQLLSAAYAEQGEEGTFYYVGFTNTLILEAEEDEERQAEIAAKTRTLTITTMLAENGFSGKVNADSAGRGVARLTPKYTGKHFIGTGENSRARGRSRSTGKIRPRP